MNLFDSPLRRKFLFASLYLSEGAPIGYIWLALPTRLRLRGVPVEEITWLTAVLVLPWTLKFAWAPLVDTLRSPRWTLRHWVLAAQCIMGLTLLPLLGLDPLAHFRLLTGFLLLHAFAAATQDVAIDALCISTTEPGERGQYNGWMQAGMLLGRASMGGGALVMSKYIGETAVVGLLIFLTTISMFLLLMSTPPATHQSKISGRERWLEIAESVHAALRDRNTWLGLLFALLGGASFKSLEVLYGPFLVDRGYDEASIGWFTVGAMIGAMILGSLAGGRLTDRVGPRLGVMGALSMIALAIGLLALSDMVSHERGGPHLLVALAAIGFGIGVFISSSYALYMDISRPLIAATQFSAFMGAMNACESWSTYLSGRIIAEYNYATAMLVMSTVSLASLPLVWSMRLIRHRPGPAD